MAEDIPEYIRDFTTLVSAQEIARKATEKAIKVVKEEGEHTVCCDPGAVMPTK